MSNNVIPGFFSTGPDDDYSVIDVYAKQTINSSLEEANSGAGSDNPIQRFASGDVGKKLGEVVDTLIAAGTTVGGQGCIKEISSKRISNEVAGGSINTSELCGNTVANLLDSIANFDLKSVDSITDVAGNAIRVAKGVEATEVQRIMDLAKDFTLSDSIPKVKDVAASMGIRNTLIDEAINLGIPNLLDDLLAVPEEVDRSRLLSKVGDIARRGDHVTLAKLASKFGSGVILSKFPETIQVVLSSYRFPTRTTTSDYDRLFEELYADLNTIDPEWLSETRNGESISYLNNFRYSSSHVKILFLRDERTLTQTLIARTYGTNTIQNVAKKTYPQIGI